MQSLRSKPVTEASPISPVITRDQGDANRETAAGKPDPQRREKHHRIGADRRQQPGRNGRTQHRYREHDPPATLVGPDAERQPAERSGPDWPEPYWSQADWSEADWSDLATMGLALPDVAARSRASTGNRSHRHIRLSRGASYIPAFPQADELGIDFNQVAWWAAEDHT